MRIMKTKQKMKTQLPSIKSSSPLLLRLELLQLYRYFDHYYNYWVVP